MTPAQPGRPPRTPLATFGVALVVIFLLSLAASCRADFSHWQYRVKPGDNLYNISKEYLKKTGDWRELQRINRVANPRRLPPDSELRVPVELLQQTYSSAELVFVRGEVSITAGDGQPIVAAIGATLPSGATIRTGSNATATLRFSDGARLLLAEQSSLVLENLVLYGKSGLLRNDLRLHEGQAETEVVPDPARQPRFQLRTPIMAVGVRGTQFRVKNAEKAGSTVEVLRGQVEARSGAQAVNLAAGFGTSVQRLGELSPPASLLPAPNLAGVAERIERVPLRLTWQPQAGATGYRIRVHPDGEPEHLVLQTLSTKTEAKWADLPDGRYVLRVRGVAGDGVEGHDAERHFTLKARPEPPFLATPIGGARIYGERVELVWTQSAETASYRLQIAEDAGFSVLRQDLTGLQAPRRILALAPGDYHWRLASLRADGDQGPFSDPQRFTLRPVPPSPPLRPPSLGEKQISFQWPAGEAGASYRFQLASEREFRNTMVDRVLPEPRIELERPPPGTYYMRAATIDADGYAGPFGPVQEFAVPRPPIPFWLYPILLVPLL